MNELHSDEKVKNDSRAATMRVLNLLEILTGYAANGAANSELAVTLKTAPANVSKDMKLLIAKGWARKSENRRFYPTPAFTRLSFRVLADFDRLETRNADQKRSMTGL